MTWTWSIPIQILPSRQLWSPMIHPKRLRVVIPTYRDWNEAQVTVESLMACRPGPGEIVLVNDNHEPGPPRWVRQYPLHLVNYPGNRGPSYARNAGARLNTGRPFDWLYFTDTACTRDPAFFTALSETSVALPRTTVAIAGPILGLATSPSASPINFYMTEEAILNPPFDKVGPQAIVTANAAVSAAAFSAMGGFDTSYPFAGGEDLDLGLRLRSIGSIGWAAHAPVYHRFAESLEDFRRRFVRYGAGNAHLQQRLALPSLRLARIVARSVALQRLADLQVEAMLDGYNRYQVALADAGQHSHPAQL